MGVAGQEQSQPERERMRLCCGVIRLLCERTGCTPAEAAKCLDETEEQISAWQTILQENNAPPPGLAEISDFCLFSLPVSQRRAVMTRLSRRHADQPSGQAQKPSPSPARNALQEHRRICAMSDYLRGQFGFLQKDAAAALGIAPSALSNWRTKVNAIGGHGITSEKVLFLLAKKVGLEKLTDLADASPRIARMRGEERQKPLPPRNEYIQSDWRRICDMIDVLRVQFLYTISQATEILHVGLPNYYKWHRKLSQNGGHGISPAEAFLQLARKLGPAQMTALADTCPRIAQKMVPVQDEADIHEPYDQEEAEWQIFLAVEILLEVPGIDRTLACASVHVSETVYEQYREKFGQREQAAEDRQRAAVLIVDLFDGELPRTQEEIRQRLQESYGQKADCFRNVLDAIRAGSGDSFEGRASDDYVPTDAMPGSWEKCEVILERIRCGDPSGFHPQDRCAYLDVKRADFIRMAIAEGMEK